MANQKLNATITIGAAISGSIKKAFGGLAGSLGKVDTEISRIVKRQRELDKQRSILERQKKPVDELTREYQKLGQELDHLRGKEQRLLAIRDASVNTAGALGGALGTVVRQGRMLAMYFGAQGIVTVGLGLMVKQVADVGDEVGETAAAIGIGTTALQELRYAAQMAGVEQQTFDSGLVSMTKNIGLAARGQGKAKKALDALGISAKKLIKLSPDQQFEALAEALSRVPNQTARAAFAMQLFGDAGKDLVLMAADGADGIQAFRKEAAALGIILDEKTVAAAGQFDDALNRSKFALTGLKYTIGSVLMPVVTDMLNSFTEFVVTHRPQIEAAAQSIGRWFERNVGHIIAFGEGIVTVGAAIANAIPQIAEFVGGWQNLGIVVTTAFMAPTIFAIGRVLWSVALLVKAITGIGTAWTAAGAAATAASGAMGAAKGTGIGALLKKGLAGAAIGWGLAEGGIRYAESKGYDRRSSWWTRDLWDSAPVDSATASRDSEQAAIDRARLHPNANGRSGRGLGTRGGTTGYQPGNTATTMNVGGITVNAPGLDAKQVAALIADKIREVFQNASSGALHDSGRR
ncbi:hypothetical protein [Fuscibacter oryzae]|uniref:Phage tail tape measure protein n=1 Tax=Fuscibacter oryzae TaxID=2803939 RepID=A0A8J7MVJ9_9RHOB|nr:hypothetical protein [Fuscibacter oryzae]MBL4929318.1 hypothetical protein [Fuscibacter oryzae]